MLILPRVGNGNVTRPIPVFFGDRKVIPIKLGTFPPRPPDKEGQAQNALVFKESMQAVDGQTMDEYLDFPLRSSIYIYINTLYYIRISISYDIINDNCMM